MHARYATAVYRVSDRGRSGDALLLYTHMRSVLLDALFWVAVIGCAMAQIFIIRAVLKPASTSPDDFSASALSSHSTLPKAPRALEIAWAFLPSLLLAAVFVLAWRTMHRPMARTADIFSGPPAAVSVRLS